MKKHISELCSSLLVMLTDEGDISHLDVDPENMGQRNALIASNQKAQRRLDIFIYFKRAFNRCVKVKVRYLCQIEYN